MIIKNYLDYVALCTKLAGYHQQYHVDGKSDLPDEEYDKLRKELMAWEAANPDQRLDLSPTLKVGGIKEESKKEENQHEYRMASLENALNKEQAVAIIKGWDKALGHNDYKLVGEFKYDGMGISLKFIDGSFTKSLSRGDGEYGEDITKHVSHFALKHIPIGGVVEVRGEAVIEHAWLEYMNLNGDTVYANCRNAVAGLMNRNLPNKFTHGIKFIPYDIVSSDMVFATQLDKLTALKDLGFDMVSCFSLPATGVHDLFRTMARMREDGSLPFDIDGAVFKINDVKQQQLLGSTSHSPRWAFAYKFDPVKAVCEIVGVVFQVGRTGEIAPVAKITATSLMGVIVTSVSLHNEEKLLKMEIAISNRYEVYRSGDVIPHFGNLVEKKVGAEPIKFPTCCPSCNEPITKIGAVNYCTNHTLCPAQQVAKIAYAVSRDVLDIEGLAEQTIELLINANLISCTADLFSVRVDEIAKLEGYTEYSANNLRMAIAKAQSQSFDRYIAALGIMDVGKSTARKLAKHIGNGHALFKLTDADYIVKMKIPDVGPSTAKNIAEYFSNPQLLDHAKRLHAWLIIPEEITTAIHVPGITGKSFVFTGSFSVPREQMEEKVVLAGGEAKSSVSAKTDYCVVGDKPGSNAKKADMLGVNVIDERVFLSLFENLS